MQDKQTNRSLVPFIRRFFSSLTDNTQIIELAVAIQQNLELGHTALLYDETIKDDLISFKNDILELKSEGFFVVRNIAMAFDPLLKISEAQYSKTV